VLAVGAKAMVLVVVVPNDSTEVVPKVLGAVDEGGLVVVPAAVKQYIAAAVALPVAAAAESEVELGSQAGLPIHKS
jgi:hypothetical protein